MTKREAVLKALRHEDVRPVPYSLSMTEQVALRMRELTGDPLFEEHAGSYLVMETDGAFEDLGGGLMRDNFGVVWDHGAQDGDIGIIRDYLLKGPTLSGFTFPQPDEGDIRAKCERLVKRRDLFTMFGIGFSLFERAWTLRSMEALMCDMVEEPAFVDELFDRLLDYNLRVVAIACEYDIDCIHFGDDWGMQRGLIMGYPMWKRFIAPRVERQYASVKAKGKYVSQHSCGDCREVFPDLAKFGLDIYNTFQPEVYDIEFYKKTFGDRITFYGGISTQALLPFATPEALKAEMRRIIGILGKDGGYILAPTHAMPSDIPPENVLAFLEVAQNQ